MSTVEQLFKALLRGPLSTRTNQETRPWAGLTVIDSGSTFVVVSTTNITSGSIVQYGISVGSVDVSAASGGAIVVNSIVDDTSFVFARQFDVANAWDDTIMWNIISTKDP